MSDIRAGQMVQLVWACCEKGRRHIGWTGTVESLDYYPESTCYCGYVTRGKHAWVDVDGRGVVPVSWLRPVDPPATDESIETPQELIA